MMSGRLCSAAPTRSKDRYRPASETETTAPASGEAPIPILRADTAVQWTTETAAGSVIARNSRGSGKNIVSVTVATVSTSIV